jgi:hypothetical protein
LYVGVLEILREIRKENQKLRDDFKKLSEQMGEGNSGRKGKSRKLCVPPEVKNTLHKVYRSFGTEKPELQWKMMEEFTSDHNQDVSSQLVREVKSVHPETPSSIIHGATKTYFVSLSGVSKMKSSGVYSAKCVQQRRRNRILRKLNLRKTTMVKSTTLSEESKRKWKPVFIPELMSSEESDDSEDGNASFTVRPLLWRSDKVSNFLSKLDEKKFNSCTQRSKRMSLKRKVGLPSDRPPPAGLPDWIVNTNH